MATIREKVLTQSNDYFLLEKHFSDETGLILTGGRISGSKKMMPKISVSVVIPAYVGSNLLDVLMLLENQSFNNFEVVVIDDCSPIPIKDKLVGKNFSYPIRVIRNLTNKGRPAARNIGVSMAEGEAVIVLDQDMLVNSDFVYNFALRQELTEHCVFLGFRENIDIAEYDNSKRANFKSDWRYKQMGDEKFVFLWPAGQKSKPENREYVLLNETDNFKNFGRGVSIGYWDLASMVISHSLCFKKKDFIESGGFPEGIFKGWGVEDIALGASMIAHGNYIIPVTDCTSYHINHERFSGSREKEWTEFMDNLVKYFEFINTPMAKIRFNFQKAKEVQSIDNIKLYEIE